MKGLGGFALVLLVRLVVRRDSLAWIGLGVLLIASSISNPNVTAIGWIALVLSSVCFVLAARVGVVAAVMSFVAYEFLVLCTPLTLDFSRWYAWRTGVVAVLLLALAVWAFRAAMGQRRILSAAMLEG
jgi:hypothetical protein